MHPSSSVSIRLPAALLTLILAGCNFDDSVPRLNQRIEALGNQLKQTDQRIVQTNQQITAVDQNIKATQAGVIDSLKQTHQQASEFVFGATQATNANNQPNLFTRHAQNELLRATTLLGMPTQQSILDANRRLELNLSQKETDLVELRRAYDLKDHDIAALQKEITAKETAITALTRHRDALGVEKDQLQSARTSLSNQVDDQKTKLIGREQDARRRAEDTKALKKQLMIYLGIAGVLCGIGAAAAFRFYPPVVIPLGTASAGFLVAAYLVTQISKWELLGILAVAGAAIGAAAYIRHHRVSKIASNTLGATQELKNRAIDGDPTAIRAYAELRNHLIEWFGDTGHQFEEEIQNRLKSLNLVGEKPPPSIVPKIDEQKKLDAIHRPALTPETILAVLKRYTETADARRQTSDA